MKKYDLYIGFLQDLPQDVKYSYYSAKSGYLLVFSDSEIAGMKKVPIEKQNRLSKEEKTWLMRCKADVNTRYIIKNSKDSLTVLDEFLNRFEKELKAESDKNIQEESV